MEPGHPLVGRPEAGGVGGEDLVAEDQLAVEEAELELGVGEDDAPLGGPVGALLVDAQRDVAGPLGQLGADQVGGLARS